MTKPGTSLYGVANGYDPLLVAVPTFSVMTIQQSTPVSGAANTLTVTVTANYNLATGSTLTSQLAMKTVKRSHFSPVVRP